MLIDKETKAVVDRFDKPNENWIGDTHYLVDSNSELATKILANSPFFDFVLDEAGELIDVTPTERPVEEYEPTTEDMLFELDYRVTCIELGL